MVDRKWGLILMVVEVILSYGKKCLNDTKLWHWNEETDQKDQPHVEAEKSAEEEDPPLS